MLASISEGVLLDRAVAQGLIAAADVAAAQKDHSVQTGPRKWGAVLDRLIAQGKLSDEAVRRLHEDLSMARPDSPALERTMDGGLEQTLQSEAGGSAPTSVLPTTTFPAPHWDKYEFIETLGRGGMGAVYRARDRRLGRLVALKFIHGDDPGMIQRFLQEARAQARLDHPYICKVYEVGSVDNKPYIAMELVEGRTLDRASAQLSLPEKLQLLKEAAEALHSAHEQGIIHRDIKPSNITTVEKH
jgi:serine/threonine protein kinase